MMRRSLLLAFLVPTGMSFAAGCGSNPCQDLVDAVAKATSKPQCSTRLTPISQAFKSVDPDKCETTDAQETLLEAQAACFNALTSCADTKQFDTLATCLVDAQSAK